MSTKPTVATLSTRVEALESEVAELKAQIATASDGIAVQLVADLVASRLSAIIERLDALETVRPSVPAPAAAPQQARSADPYDEYAHMGAPSRQSPKGAVQQRPPVEPRPNLRVYTHTQGARKGQSFQYWKDGGKTTMVRVFGPAEGPSTGLPKAPVVVDDLPPPAAAPEDADLVCPF